MNLKWSHICGSGQMEELDKMTNNISPKPEKGDLVTRWPKVTHHFPIPNSFPLARKRLKVRPLNVSVSGAKGCLSTLKGELLGIWPIYTSHPTEGALKGFSCTLSKPQTCVSIEPITTHAKGKHANVFPHWDRLHPFVVTFFVCSFWCNFPGKTL